MVEEFRVIPKTERETLERLKKEKGIFYFEIVDPKTNEKKKMINILGVELETYATKEDLETIKKEIVLSKTDQKLLRVIAESYKLREPLMIEGDPGAGKTFLLRKFVQLIHGASAPILELNGSPRTSELEILGHWAPKGLTEEENEEYQKALKAFMDAKESGKLRTEFEQKLSQLSNKLQERQISQEEFNDQFGELTNRYINELKNLIFESSQMVEFINKINKPVEWEFKKGALLQAYSGRGGKGYILIVNEFNLIPSNYQQIFLQIGGEKGTLSDFISFWGDAGKTVYKRGKDTMIFFTSNYPEKTPGTNPVVAPMTDRLVWWTLSPVEVHQKKEIMISTAGGRLRQRLEEFGKIEKVEVPVKEPLSWYEVLGQKLGELIADIVNLLDKEFVNYYETVGDSLPLQRRRRIQQIEFSSRNPLRLFAYLDHFQIRNPETGLVDFTATLKNAFERYYISRLVNPNARNQMMELFNKILGLNITPEELERIQKSEEILKAGGKGLPIGVTLFEGKIRTIKEVLDILTEYASQTPEEKEEREVKKALKDLINFQDSIESELKNLKKDVNGLYNLEKK